jgi:Fur family ferric uptake transcriptional regulator
VQVRETLQRLTDRGLRLTEQRRRVVARVHALEEHFDAEDLVRSLSWGEERVSRATIYRLLPLLVEADVLREVMPWRPGGSHGSRRRYELVETTKHHEHLVCEDCGAVIEVHDRELEEAIDSAADRLGFEMRRHSVEILGICPQCAGSRAPKEDRS